jgi:DnaJ family protein C protein 2
MAVTKEILRLMPPSPNSPKEPKCYGSPAKRVAKRECMRVERMPSIDRLHDMREQALNAARSSPTEGEDGEADGEDDGEVGKEQTTKKSDYWSKEVEEKLGFGGADPYGLLELEDKRWRATADELRKAYRRLVLQHHPDKKAGEEATKALSQKNGNAKTESKKEEKKAEKKKAKKGEEENGEEAEENDEEAEEKEGEGEDDDDAEFKLLGAAWELLGNAEMRRAFDSIDYFNDNLPTAFNAKRSTRGFYGTFGPGFKRQAKFSVKTPAPQLGDDSTSHDDVNRFYKFWFEFTSWRDFALLAEHDYKEAEDREERRWMQRQNKNYTDRLKKDERQRVAAFVQHAYDNDPRVAAIKEKAAAEKAAIKEAKEAALRSKKEKEEAATREKEEAERAVKEAAEAEKAAAKAAGADAKREKERLRSALKKVRKELKELGADGKPWAARAADIELVAAVLSIEQLTSLIATLSAGESDEANAALDAARQQAAKA